MQGTIIVYDAVKKEEKKKKRCEERRACGRRRPGLLDHGERRTASVNHGPAGILPQRDSLDDHNLWNYGRVCG